MTQQEILNKKEEFYELISQGEIEEAWTLAVGINPESVWKMKEVLEWIVNHWWKIDQHEVRIKAKEVLTESKLQP